MKHGYLKTLNKICKMTQEQLADWAIDKLKALEKDLEIDSGNYIYAEGTFPVLICAHLDTVHKDVVKDTTYDKVNDILTSPQGIGGDDRCGVAIIFEILKKFDCHVCFFYDEEVGGLGSAKFANTLTAKYMDVNYILEFDRKGNNEAVYYSCDNPEFKDFIEESYWHEEFGSFTDICNFAPIIGLSAVNLSCGYYNAHTKSEYIKIRDMQKVTDEALKILERTDTTKCFEYVPKKEPVKPNYYYNNYKYMIDDYMNTYCFMYLENGIQYVAYEDGYTEEEAFMYFMMDHPTICYNDIIDFALA